jgi:hypothetical protein
MKSFKKNFTGLSILFVSVFILNACNNSTKSSGDDKNQVFQHRIIHVGYISYPPGFIVDPNTKEKSGIFNDILVEIAKKK